MLKFFIFLAATVLGTQLQNESEMDFGFVGKIGNLGNFFNSNEGLTVKKAYKRLKKESKEDPAMELTMALH